MRRNSVQNGANTGNVSSPLTPRVKCPITEIVLLLSAIRTRWSFLKSPTRSVHLCFPATCQPVVRIPLWNRRHFTHVIIPRHPSLFQIAVNYIQLMHNFYGLVHWIRKSCWHLFFWFCEMQTVFSKTPLCKMSHLSAFTSMPNPPDTTTGRFSPGLQAFYVPYFSFASRHPYFQHWPN